MPELEQCTNVFRAKYNLPCSHELYNTLYCPSPGPIESLRFGAKWKLHNREVFDQWFAKGQQLHKERVWEAGQAVAEGPVAIRDPCIRLIELLTITRPVQ